METKRHFKVGFRLFLSVAYNLWWPSMLMKVSSSPLHEISFFLHTICSAARCHRCSFSVSPTRRSHHSPMTWKVDRTVRVNKCSFLFDSPDERHVFMRNLVNSLQMYPQIDLHCYCRSLGPVGRGGGVPVLRSIARWAKE